MKKLLWLGILVGSFQVKTHNWGDEVVVQISWAHNKLILDKCKNTLEAEFYIKKCIFIGWSKYDLQRNISEKLFENSLLAQNNLDKTLYVNEEVKQLAEKEIEESWFAKIKIEYW